MIRVPRGQWASQDKRVIKETKVCQGWLDLKEKKVLLAHQVPQDQRAQQGHGVFQGLKVREGLEADLEALVKKVTQGLRDFLAGMDNQGYQDHKGHRGTEEHQDLKG